MSGTVKKLTVPFYFPFRFDRKESPVKKLIGLLAVIAIFATAGYAGVFRPEEWYHIPAHGPAPAKHMTPALQGDVHPSFLDGENHPKAPHVHMDEKWIGHNTGSADPHYKLANPWANGHFPKEIGRKHTWQLVRGRSDRGVFVVDEYLFKVPV